MNLDNIFHIITSYGKNISFSEDIDPDLFHFNINESENDLFPYAYAGGQVSHASATRCKIDSSQFFIFIYTVNGQSNIKLPGSEMILNKNSLFILTPYNSCELRTIKAPYIYKLLLIEGTILESYLKTIANGNLPCTLLHENCSEYLSNTYSQIIRLLGNDTPYSKLLFSKYINDIFCDIAFSRLSDEDITTFPKHVQKLKSLLDEEYMDIHTLDSLADEIGINKYRLCHDFSDYMKISPMKYLSQVRIERAQKLLIETDMPVHTIGEAVGIYNTTAFINQFKKLTTYTPQNFRQQMTHGLF